MNFDKILITGAAGQLGRRLTDKLKGSNGNILAMDITHPDRGPDTGNVSMLEADITRLRDLERHRDLLEGVEYLVHLASVIEDSRDIKKDAGKAIEIDIKGTLNLLGLLPQLKGICYASTYMVYGPTVYLPMTEAHPTEPVNIYGVCKLGAEKFLRLYAMENRVPVAALRYTGIYGPGTPVDSGRIIPSFIRRTAAGQEPVIYGEGTEKRPALYIDDAVDAVMLSLNATPRELFEAYNISGAASFSATELAEIVIELSGKKLTPRYEKASGTGPSGLAHVEIDITKAKDQLKFDPRFNLEAGIADHIKWFESRQ